jgi:hypothetical protein
VPARCGAPTPAWPPQRQPQHIQQEASLFFPKQDHGYGGVVDGDHARIGGWGPQPTPPRKAVSHHWINKQITAASETGRLEELTSIVSNLLPQMNLVNLSTAIHRIAKLAGGPIHGQSVLFALTKSLCVELYQVPIESTLPQSLSNITWSLATLHINDAHLLDVIGNVSMSCMHFFKPFELSSLIWGFAKIGSEDGGITCIRTLFRAAADRTLDSIKCFTVRSLATIAWAFAKARQHSARFFRLLAGEISLKVGDANSQEIANTAWAFGTAGQREVKLFNCLAEAALPALEHFKCQEISNLLWGFATKDFFHQALFEKALRVVQGKMSKGLLPQHFANILWACARVRPRHPALRTAAVALLPACTRMLPEFKPQELSSTMLAVAKMFGQECEEDTGLIMQPQDPLPPAVQAFAKAVMPLAITRVQRFSEQSLANIVTAFTMLQVPDGYAVLSVMEQETINRASKLNPQELMQVMKSFLCFHHNSVQVLHVLAGNLLLRYDDLRMQDLHMLTHLWVVSRHFTHGHNPSHEDLYRWVRFLAGQGTKPEAYHMGPPVQQVPARTRAPAQQYGTAAEEYDGYDEYAEEYDGDEEAAQAGDGYDQGERPQATYPPVPEPKPSTNESPFAAPNLAAFKLKNTFIEYTTDDPTEQDMDKLRRWASSFRSEPCYPGPESEEMMEEWTTAMPTAMPPPGLGHSAPAAKANNEEKASADVGRDEEMKTPPLNEEPEEQEEEMIKPLDSFDTLFATAAKEENSPRTPMSEKKPKTAGAKKPAYKLKNTFIESQDEHEEDMVKLRMWATDFRSMPCLVPDEQETQAPHIGDKTIIKEHVPAPGASKQQVQSCQRAPTSTRRDMKVAFLQLDDGDDNSTDDNDDDTTVSGTTQERSSSDFGVLRKEIPTTTAPATTGSKPNYVSFETAMSFARQSLFVPFDGAPQAGSSD